MGFVGADWFYLGKIWKGIANIIATIANIGLFILTFYLADTLTGSFSFAVMKKEIVIHATTIHLICAVVAIAYCITHIIVLAINRAKARTNAMLVNKEILKLKNDVEEVSIDHWKIG